MVVVTDLKVVALLLELSADLEFAVDGLTPLCVAAEAGHLEALKSVEPVDSLMSKRQKNGKS